MIAAVCLASLISGGGLACAARTRPSHAVALEACGGVLIVMGLALLGAGLELTQP